MQRFSRTNERLGVVGHGAHGQLDWEIIKTERLCLYCRNVHEAAIPQNVVVLVGSNGGSGESVLGNRRPTQNQAADNARMSAR